MGRGVKECSRKATSSGRKSQRKRKCPKGSTRRRHSRGTGRNPFFRFLAYFRKCNRKRLGHLPSRRVVLLAGRRWRRMSRADKEPFVAAARGYRYAYRSRSKRVNWLLEKLRGGGECQAQDLWMLMQGMKSWQQGVLHAPGGVEQ